MRKIATFLLLEVRFFQGGCFFLRSRPGFQTMPKTISSFRNFKNRVHTLKWWVFSSISKRYTCGIPFSNNSIAHLVLEKNNYLSKGKWEHICLLHQTWRKETDTWWKVGTWKFTEKVGWELILIILMFP